MTSLTPGHGDHAARRRDHARWLHENGLDDRDHDPLIAALRREAETAQHTDLTKETPPDE